MIVLDLREETHWRGFMAGERDVPEAASCRPWNRTVEGSTSAVSGAMEGEANGAEGICRLPAFPESGISVGCPLRTALMMPHTPRRETHWETVSAQMPATLSAHSMASK